LLHHWHYIVILSSKASEQIYQDTSPVQGKKEKSISFLILNFFVKELKIKTIMNNNTPIF